MCETKNENSSNLLRGISENGGILFYGIDSTAIVRRMEQLHKTSAVTTAALGRLLTGVAMMGQMLKSDSDSVTVQIRGRRPGGPYSGRFQRRGRCKKAMSKTPSWSCPARGRPPERRRCRG